MQFLLLISHDDGFVPSDELAESVHDGAREVTVGPATSRPDETAAYELVESGVAGQTMHLRFRVRRER